MRGKPKTVDGKSVTVYLSRDLIQWVNEQVNKTMFESFSDGVRKCIQHVKKGEFDE